MTDVEGLAPDQEFALQAAAANLAGDFKGVVGAATIERFLLSSYEEFANRSTVVNYLPLIAERFVRQRLKALTRVETRHDDGVPIVLFLCVRNTGRSQMALGWLNHLAGDRAVAWSGGSKPGTEVNPAVVAAMAEVGIDLSDQLPKPWSEEIVRAADVVITLGCGDACPIYPGKRYADWDVADPEGKDVEAVRPIRDEIGRRVRDLLGDLAVDGPV